MNENDVIDFDEIKWELRKRKVKTFFKELPGKTVKFVNEHGKELAAAIPTAVIIGRKLSKIHDDRKEQYHRDREIYDYSLHRWCELKRKMTQKEELEFKERRRKGETVYDILNSMRILKR